jgi:hypothetical protein
LGLTYRPHLGFTPASDQGSLEADQKAANLCLLRPPPQPPEAALHAELLELEALEQEAGEMEASRHRLAAAEWEDEGELWPSQGFDAFDP